MSSRFGAWQCNPYFTSHTRGAPPLLYNLQVAENLHLLCELLGGRDETQLEQTIELDEALLGAPRFLRLARGGSRQLPEILRMHSDGLVDSSQPHNVALTSGIVCLHPAALAIELWL